jgi:hypothetical protein
VTLRVGVRTTIRAHKVVLAAHSSYLHGLLTSGLAESSSDEITLDLDEHAVDAIVDCFYSGRLALSGATVCSVIRTANMLGVAACEKAACDYLAASLDTDSAADALGFAAQLMHCSQHGRELHGKCMTYMMDYFDTCAQAGTFNALDAQTMAALLASDQVSAPELAVLNSARAWFEHDTAGRLGSLPELVALIRWPLLSTEIRSDIANDPLLAHLMHDSTNRPLREQIIAECAEGFADCAAASTCPRLKWRAVRPLGDGPPGAELVLAGAGNQLANGFYKAVSNCTEQLPSGPVYYKLDAHGRFAVPLVMMIPARRDPTSRNSHSGYVVFDKISGTCLYEDDRDAQLVLASPPVAWRTVMMNEHSISPAPTLSFVKDNCN